MKELNRLKIKFVFFNMILVTAILAFALTGGIMLIKKHVRKESQEVLSRVVMQETAETIFQTAAYARIPYFSVSVKTDGQLTLLDGSYNSFQRENFPAHVVCLVEESGLESGELEDYHLRFQRVSYPGGCLFVFADTSYEDSIEGSMVKSMFFICSVIWLCLFAVSCLFANWTVKPVEESILRQKQFVADASHELKTPLTIIAANAELLAGCCGGISSDADKWLRNMNQECGEMRSLIESLLILAKNDALFEKRRCRETCSISELTEEEALTFETVFFQNRKTITYEIEDGLEIWGSEALIRKLLGILLDNAVKYSEQGGKTEVSLKKAGKRKIRLQVKSQGEPIPESEQKAVFRRFYRADRARSSGQGYGLGLAIASEIVRECRGKIGLETDKDGNCFYVLFWSAERRLPASRKA